MEGEAARRPPIDTWLDTKDVQGLVSNVKLIGLGNGESRMLAANFDQSVLGALLHNAKIGKLVPAMHFTALPMCKPMAEEILIEEQDDPVCSDPDGTDREAVHTTIVERILTNLAGD